MTPSPKIHFAEPLAEALGKSLVVRIATDPIAKNLPPPPPPAINAYFLGSVGRRLVKNLISQKITMEVPYEQG